MVVLGFLFFLRVWNNFFLKKNENKDEDIGNLGREK